MRHSTSSATWPQMRQNRTSSLTRWRMAVSRTTSTGSAASRWNAIRWALFGPIPGSRPSSSMRSWMAPSYIGDYSRLHARQAEAATERVETAAERTHLLGGELLGVVAGVAYRGDHQVGEGLDVVGIDDLGVDLERAQLAA